MEKKIVLIGKSCSGKTELATMLQENGCRPALSTTSRPIRHNEIPDISYRFVTRDYFEKLLANEQFVEWDEFNDWYYGLTKSDYDNCDLLILTPRGLEKLIHAVGRENLVVIFIHTPDEVRLDRSLKRGDDPKEVNRRMKADDKDFAEYIKSKDWDLAMDYQMTDKFRFLSKLFSNFKN
jgi:guanylate kinase